MKGWCGLRDVLGVGKGREEVEPRRTRRSTEFGIRGDSWVQIETKREREREREGGKRRGWVMGGVWVDRGDGGLGQ
jgi:hypothetical protein